MAQVLVLKLANNICMRSIGATIGTGFGFEAVKQYLCAVYTVGATKGFGFEAGKRIRYVYAVYKG